MSQPLPEFGQNIVRLAGGQLQTLIESLGGGLRNLGGAQFTVGAAVVNLVDEIGIDGVTAAILQLEVGGPIRINSTAGSNPTAGGAEGSPERKVDSTWTIIGSTDFLAHQLIRATGGVDGTVTVLTFGP